MSKKKAGKQAVTFLLFGSEERGDNERVIRAIRHHVGSHRIAYLNKAQKQGNEGVYGHAFTTLETHGDWVFVDIGQEVASPQIADIEDGNRRFVTTSEGKLCFNFGLWAFKKNGTSVVIQAGADCPDAKNFYPELFHGPDLMPRFPGPIVSKKFAKRLVEKYSIRQVSTEEKNLDEMCEKTTTTFIASSHQRLVKMPTFSDVCDLARSRQAKYPNMSCKVSAMTKDKVKLGFSFDSDEVGESEMRISKREMIPRDDVETFNYQRRRFLIDALKEFENDA